MKSTTGELAAPSAPASVSRRKFLSRAAARTAGAAAAGVPTFAMAQEKPAAPAVVSATAVTRMRWQSAWAAKDIFQEYALDFARKVHDMTGGELRIEVLPAGAVVSAYGLLDAVSKGALDGAHGGLSYHFKKSSALGLWGSGPAFGMDANTVLAWHKYGGGKELLTKIYQSVGAQVVSFLYGPMPTQPLGWFKKPIAKVEDFGRLKYRTTAVSSDVFTALGAEVKPLPAADIVPAMQTGLLDAAEFNNATSDRLLGLPDVARVCMLQSFHQSAEQFEILFNNGKFAALPAQIRAVVENAVDAASADMSWKAMHRYSQDYMEMQEQGVVFYKTPDPILHRQLTAYDQATAKQISENPLFKSVVESQRRFAERVVRWDLDTGVDRRMAYRHYFAGNKAAKKKS